MKPEIENRMFICDVAHTCIFVEVDLKIWKMEESSENFDDKILGLEIIFVGLVVFKYA